MLQFRNFDVKPQMYEFFVSSSTRNQISLEFPSDNSTIKKCAALFLYSRRFQTVK